MSRVEFAEDALRDLELILLHLAESYRGFGEAPDEALDHAARRVRAIVKAADRLAVAPHRGAVHDELAPGVRHLTLDRAVYYFRVGGGEDAPVRVLAVFFGGQDHQRRMRLRILRRE
jgi:plasmid stabilization system protein ParE